MTFCSNVEDRVPNFVTLVPNLKMGQCGLAKREEMYVCRRRRTFLVAVVFFVDWYSPFFAHLYVRPKGQWHSIGPKISMMPLGCPLKWAILENLVAVIFLSTDFPFWHTFMWGKKASDTQRDQNSQRDRFANSKVFLFWLFARIFLENNGGKYL